MGLSSGNLMTRCPSSWNGKLYDFSKKGEHWVNRSSGILKTSSQGPARIVKRSLCNALLTFVRMVVSSMVGKWLPKIPQSSDFWLRKLFSWRPSHLGDSDNLRFTTRNFFKTLAFKRIREIVKQPIPSLSNKVLRQPLILSLWAKTRALRTRNLVRPSVARKRQKHARFSKPDCALAVSFGLCQKCSIHMVLSCRC